MLITHASISSAHATLGNWLCGHRLAVRGNSSRPAVDDDDGDKRVKTYITELTDITGIVTASHSTIQSLSTLVVPSPLAPSGNDAGALNHIKGPPNASACLARAPAFRRSSSLQLSQRRRRNTIVVVRDDGRANFSSISLSCTARACTLLSKARGFSTALDTGFA